MYYIIQLALLQFYLHQFIRNNKYNYSNTKYIINKENLKRYSSKIRKKKNKKNETN